jgi:hypothetical protein
LVIGMVSDAFRSGLGPAVWQVLALAVAGSVI